MPALVQSTEWNSALKQALADIRLTGDSLKETLEKKLPPSESGEVVEYILKEVLGLKETDIRDASPPADVLRLVPPECAKTYCLLPLDLVGDTLNVAMADPTDADLLADLKLLTGCKIEPVLAKRAEIEEAIAIQYRNGSHGRDSAPGTGTTRFEAYSADKKNKVSIRSVAETPIVHLVNEMISDAIHTGASDIHFEPFEREMKVRFRQDGLLRVYRTINSRSMPEVISRVKIMANMDIAEKRRPQDGRIRVENGKKAVDMRVSTLPTENGEKIVLRILDKSAVALELPALGFPEKALELFRNSIRQPYGMILVTGPTGSGKTTTLYSALSEIQSPEVNISTIEDPIEYKLEGIVQSAVRADLNLTFAKALRTLLRQDPDVIMLGEIRDEETAQMAIRSALTGHLLLSTLHTNDAPSAITRLLDMGIEPFLLSSALSLLVAQRLVRQVCSSCFEEVETDRQETQSLGLEAPLTFRRGKGCARCHFTGYSGRIALFEILPVTESIRQTITRRGDASEIRQIAMKEGMATLRQDGMDKLIRGVTTPEEILRETT